MMRAAVLVHDTDDRPVAPDDVDDFGSGTDVDCRNRVSGKDGVERRAAYREAVTDRTGLLWRPLVERTAVKGEVLAAKRRSAGGQHIVEHTDLVQRPDQTVTTEKVRGQCVRRKVTRLEKTNR